MTIAEPVHVPTRCIRVRIDAELHRGLGHVAIDRRLTLADLIREGARLVLAQHGDGQANTHQNKTKV